MMVVEETPAVSGKGFEVFGVDFKFEAFGKRVVGHEGEEFELVEGNGFQRDFGAFAHAWFALKGVLDRVQVRGLGRQFSLASAAGAEAGEETQQFEQFHQIPFAQERVFFGIKIHQFQSFGEQGE